MFNVEQCTYTAFLASSSLQLRMMKSLAERARRFLDVAVKLLSLCVAAFVAYQISYYYRRWQIATEPRVAQEKRFSDDLSTVL